MAEGGRTSVELGENGEKKEMGGSRFEYRRFILSDLYSHRFRPLTDNTWTVDDHLDSKRFLITIDVLRRITQFYMATGLFYRYFVLFLADSL